MFPVRGLFTASTGLPAELYPHMQFALFSFRIIATVRGFVKGKFGFLSKHFSKHRNGGGDGCDGIFQGQGRAALLGQVGDVDETDPYFRACKSVQ